MKSQSYITISVSLFVLAFSALHGSISAQRIAILTHQNTGVETRSREKLRKHEEFRFLDDQMSDSVLASAGLTDVSNLSSEESKTLGSALGARFLVVLRGDTFRRRTFENPKFFESFLSVAVVDAKRGTRVFWGLFTSEDPDATVSEKLLLEKIGNFVTTLKESVVDSPEPGAGPSLCAEAQDHRPPLPFKRISPSYPSQANRYSIAATIDAEATIGADGKVFDVRFLRWAGFGLEESVESTIRAMNWRAGDSGGKPCTAKILLRYNFQDLEDN
ncbi:MAG: energy transducer TonB [Pyrinomonadaceae bacterium]